MTTTTPASVAAEEFNGVPVAKLRGTVAKLKENPELARFRFSARNGWLEGTASTSVSDQWYGVGTNHEHVRPFETTVDHPTLGHGHGATPHELVLQALAGCLVAGIVTNAASRDIALESIETVVRGEMDVRGILGIDPDVRNGFAGIEVEIDVQGDADRSALDALIAASTKRSAVVDSLTNPTNVVVRSAN